VRNPKVKPSARFKQNINAANGWKIPIGHAVTIAISLITFCFYLVGAFLHTQYLDDFHVPGGIYPESPQDIFIFTYLALLEWVAAVATAVTQEFRLLAAFSGLVVLILLLNEEVGKSFAKDGIKLRLWMKNSHDAGRTAGAFLVLPIMTITATYLLCIGIAIVVIAPPMLGFFGASRMSAADMKNFSGGCSKPAKKSAVCNELYFEGKFIARGFVIDSSENHISLYENGQTITYPLKNFEVRQFIRSAQPGSHT